MKKTTILMLSFMLFATLTLSVPIVFAGYSNANGDNGYQGTNKASSQLPDTSMVPPPAGILEDFFVVPNVVEGCRAGGGDITVSVPGLGPVLGGPCCKGPEIETGVYAPNQCCNPPDIIYPNPDDWTPGNHCLCFVMRNPFP
jgi:hypothetical protein